MDVYSYGCLYFLYVYHINVCIHLILHTVLYHDDLCRVQKRLGLGCGWDHGLCVVSKCLSMLRCEKPAADPKSVSRKQTQKHTHTHTHTLCAHIQQQQQKNIRPKPENKPLENKNLLSLQSHDWVLLLGVLIPPAVINQSCSFCFFPLPLHPILISNGGLSSSGIVGQFTALPNKQKQHLQHLQ